MKINVQSIDGIEPQIEMRAPATLVINAHLTNYQMEVLFYRILEYAGIESIQKWLNDEAIIEERPLPKDYETEAKMVLSSMYIAKGYSAYKNEGWTDDDLLKAMKLMTANYRKYLLKITEKT